MAGWNPSRKTPNGKILRFGGLPGQDAILDEGLAAGNGLVENLHAYLKFFRNNGVLTYFFLDIGGKISKYPTQR
jgi:hypothetical protein